jgi:hypothetical protein
MWNTWVPNGWRADFRWKKEALQKSEGFVSKENEKMVKCQHSKIQEWAFAWEGECLVKKGIFQNESLHSCKKFSFSNEKMKNTLSHHFTKRAKRSFKCEACAARPSPDLGLQAPTA